MATYVLAAIAAAFIQVGIVYFLRGHFARGLPYAIPFILISQFLFLWIYSSAPKFTIIWFTTTALTSVLAFVIGYFLWQEQISSWNIVGILLILAGIVLLQLK